MREPDMLLPAPPDVGVETCAVYVSERARRLQIRIRLNGSLELTVPRGVSGNTIRGFLAEMTPWIRRTLPKVRHRAAAAQKKDTRFPDEVTLGFLGETYRTRYWWQDRCWTAVRLDREEKTLLFTGCVLDRDSVLGAFSELLRRTALPLFTEELRRQSERTEIPFRRCTVRIQSSRWGSCTAEGNISLNAKLLFFPPEIAEYVMIHELCHRREMNHSEAFWAEVASFLPDWKERRRALRRLADELPESLRKL